MSAVRMKMEAKFFLTFLFTTGLFGTSLGFWSLETDLQFGYEIYDRSYEINSAIQAILTASTRSSVIQNDPTTKSAVIALNSIADQLRSTPITFFSELGNAAASRTNNENWHITRLRTYHAAYVKQLEILSNYTGPLKGLEGITNPSIMQTMRDSLDGIIKYSYVVLSQAEDISLRVSQIRANSSLLLTPQLINDFIEDHLMEETQSILIQLRNSYLLFLSSVRDTARLTGAYGSMYDILDRSFIKDYEKRNTSLYNFVNSYNRVRNTLLTSVVSYRQAAQSGFTNFIQRVQSTYDDSIVRPRFEREQLPLILAFVEVVTSKVYNQTFFETSFDGMRDSIVYLYSNETNDVFIQDSQYRDVILNLLRQSFVRHYASCLNNLVSESQVGRNILTGKYAFCLDERTSSITVVIPSTSSWLSVIRDNVNFILDQLNACLNGQISVAGRTAASECIQSNANNLQFYAMYLPLTVQTNLRPIVQSPPLIFQNCIGVIKANNNNYESFKDIYEECRDSSFEGTTKPPITEATTEPIEVESTTSFNNYTTIIETNSTTPSEPFFNATTTLEFNSTTQNEESTESTPPDYFFERKGEDI